MSDFDLFIIGAGPAGLMAAVSAAAAGKRVGVAEFLPSAGRKLLASGSGKCNLTNLLTPEEMAARFTANPRRVLPALRAFPPEELRLWFRRRGVPTSPVDGFHCFPDSQRAGDLLDALLREAAQYGVRIFCNTAVDGLLISDGKIAGCRAGKREFRTGKLIIAGEGPQEASLRRKGAKLPNPPVIGFHPKEELHSIISYCDLYVHPSYAEIESIACVEAISCGLVPVISDSPMSAAKYFALDKEKCLYPMGDVKALSQRIDYMIEHPEERAALREQYIEYAERFQIEKCIDKMVEMFEDAAAGRHAAAVISTKKG